MNTPWSSDPLELVGGEDGMPRSPASLLKALEGSQARVGVISLVVRIETDPPVFATWVFDQETRKWTFDGARAQDGTKLSVNDLKGLANEDVPGRGQDV